MARGVGENQARVALVARGPARTAENKGTQRLTAIVDSGPTEKEVKREMHKEAQDAITANNPDTELPTALSPNALV